MIRKRMLLKEMLEEGTVSRITVIFEATEEVKDYISKGKEMNLFLNYNLETKLHRLEETYVSTTALSIAKLRNSNDLYVFCINAELISSKEGAIKALDTVVKDFSVEVIEYFDFNLSPYHAELYIQNKFNLSDFREAQGDTQKKFAEKLGISRPLVIAIEKGERNASHDFLAKFKKAFPFIDLNTLFFKVD